MSGLAGIYPAVVISTSDPRGRGRVRLQVPSVSGTAVSGWAAPAAAGGRLPAVRERIWVVYQQGDPSHPVYLPPMPGSGQEVPHSPIPAQATYQVSEPNYSVDQGNWVDFTTGQWPRIALAVPPSGILAVTVSGRLRNINTATSTAWLSYRITGGATRAVEDTLAFNVQNSARTQASRRTLVTGLPAGAGVTVVPVWRVSSYGSGSTEVSGGELIVEPLRS